MPESGGVGFFINRHKTTRANFSTVHSFKKVILRNPNPPYPLKIYLLSNMNLFSFKYRYFFIILLAVYSFANTLYSEVYTHYDIQATWYQILLVFFFVTLSVWEGNRGLQVFLLRTLDPAHTVRYLVISLLAGMICSALVSIGVVYAFAGILKLTASQIRMPLRLMLTYGTRINLFLHILNATFIYMMRFRDKQLETEELKRINAHAELQAIKNQINPHFLFNNLNVLSSLVLQENPDANKFIEEFSKVYRNVLNSQQQELITLGSDLETIQPYIYLLNKRFPDSISVDIHVAHRFHSFYVIPVAIQMLIENAIKHNIVSASRPLKIELHIIEGDRLIVTNNLQLKTIPEMSTQIGLQNISKRYLIITGRNIEILKDEKHFSVILPLIQPAHEDSDHRR